ncbi:hypothetical protein FS837_008761 [Tulasnella sp. UAMH 9824]|nr:hypothetical protein FS837_008761 [Tulasnella sp. UAMH 9824]
MADADGNALGRTTRETSFLTNTATMIPAPPISDLILLGPSLYWKSEATWFPQNDTTSASKSLSPSWTSRTIRTTPAPPKQTPPPFNKTSSPTTSSTKTFRPWSLLLRPPISASAGKPVMMMGTDTVSCGSFLRVSHSFVVAPWRVGYILKIGAVFSEIVVVKPSARPVPHKFSTCFPSPPV